MIFARRDGETELYFNIISEVYRLYGFRQIETPAMENLDTLMGKYGEEGDKLLFKILNSGDFLSAMSTDDITEGNPARTANKISEKGLRYDLTVPFARYVVMHRNEISFPLKGIRYSLYGGPTVPRKVVTESFSSAMPILLVPTLSLTRWNWCKLLMRSFHV